MCNNLDWEDTNFLVNLVREEFVRQHNKHKDHQVEKDFVSLRRLAVELHERRIKINVERMKCLKTN